MRIITFLLSILFFQNLSAQDQATALQDLRVDVVYLASDLLEGRETGKKGEALAAQYIAHRFAEVGLEPLGTEATWFQPFDFTYKSNPHAEEGELRTGKNVVGYLDFGAENTIIVGAHYDHLGYGTVGSLHAGEKAIHNGADDNASGVAAMIYIAEQLKKSSLKRNNYLFIAFSGEEMGLIGSKAYTKNPTIDLKKVNYMMNMDMVGRLNEERVLAINGVGTSPVWKEVLPLIKVGNINPKTTDSGIGPSDHTSFYVEEIPVLHFFTGQHTDYHKPVDDSHLVNYEGLYDVANFMLAIIEQLNDNNKIEYTETKQEQQRTASKFKVTLGVMPDYVYDGEGMRVDAVIGGRPAAKGGMKRGDVIIKIGNQPVKDIYDYMDGLSHFKEGDKAKVRVRRGEKVKELMVQF